jgi:hypothetical protein
VNVRGSAWKRWRLILATVAVAILPASVLAADLQPTSGPNPFGGTIDVQPGAINGQVSLEPGSVSLRASLSDPGVDGHLQVTVPGQFVGSGTAANGALSYDLTMCGAGLTFALSGTSTSDVHVAFHDAASDPDACSTAPSAAQSPLLMMNALEMATQAQPPASGVAGQALLVNWLRRLVGFSLLGLLLVLLIPAMPSALAVATQTPPWARIGIGLALALTLPLLGVLLFAIGLPVGLWWLGALALALYPALLVSSMSVSGLAVGSWASRLVSRPGVPVVLAFAVGMLVLTFASLLPYVGPVVNIAAVTFGLGTLVLAPRSRPPGTPDSTIGVGPAARDQTAPPVTPSALAA